MLKIFITKETYIYILLLICEYNALSVTQQYIIIILFTSPTLILNNNTKYIFF